ncbi:MAG: CHAT domain-containing protein [Nitrospiraceae bacterium]
MVKTLLIAPSVGLGQADEEVQRVVNWLHPEKVMLGGVTAEEVLDALGTGPYDLIWFATHGTSEGIELSDGLLRTRDLVQLLQGSQVKCIFLNTCSSVAVAIRLHDWIKTAAVVSTSAETDDVVAARTGALFAQYLAQGKSWREAYELSKPVDADYIYINDSLTGNEMLALMDEIRQSEGRVKEALVAETIQLRARLDALEAQRRPTVRRRVQWTIGYLLYSYVAYPLAYDGIRERFGVSDREALLTAIFVMAMSGVLMMRGVGLARGDWEW